MFSTRNNATIITRLDVCAEMSAEARVSVQAAMKILDDLEVHIGESWLNNDAVLLPAVGELDALDRDADPNAVARRTWTFDDYVDVIAVDNALDAIRVRRALASAFDFIEQRRHQGDIVWVPLLGLDGDRDLMLEIDEKRTREAIELISKSTRPVWVLQCNPERYDIDASFITDGLPESWSIARYLDDVAIGDLVVFWISGPQAGVRFVGDVTKLPFAGSLDQFAGSEAGKMVTMIGIDLFLDLWDRPVLRSDLKHLDAFVDESIIKIPRQANPHTLGHAALGEILARVQL